MFMMRKSYFKKVLRRSHSVDNLVAVYGGHPALGRYLPGVQLIYFSR